MGSHIRRTVDRIRETGRVIWSGGRGWILLVISIGWMLALGVRLVFPALLPQIKAEFALDNTTAGVLISSIWVAYATSQVPGGVLNDRIGDRNILTLAVVLATVSILVVVVAPVFGVFILGVVGFGLSTGLYGTPRVTVVSNIYPDRGGTALGIANASGNVGTSVIPVAAGVLAGVFGWRFGIGVTLPGFALVAIGLWLVVPERTTHTRRSIGAESPRATIRRVAAALNRQSVLRISAVMILLMFVYQGFTGFLTTYLVDIKGLSPERAATLLGLFFAGGVASQLIAGGASDRYGRRMIMTVSVVATGIALMIFPFLSTIELLGAAILVSSMQLAIWPVAFEYTTTVLPDDVQGSGFGLIRTVYLYTSAIGPIVVGALADADLFDEAYLMLASVTALAVGVCLVLPTAEPE